MERDRGYIRFQHKAHALRHRKITEEIYKIENYFSNFNKYDSFKIHCSCPICSAKTNNKKHNGPRGWWSSKNWSISDQKKINSMESQVEELVT